MIRLSLLAALFWLPLTLNAGELSLGCYWSVTNGVEHWNEPDTPYNENPNGRICGLELALNPDPAFGIKRYLSVETGGITNSQYDPTDVNYIAGRASVGESFKYMWSAGVMGFKGYDKQPEHYEGFFYVPAMSHAVGYEYEGLTAVYRQYWLPVSNVTAEFYGLSYSVSLPF